MTYGGFAYGGQAYGSQQTGSAPPNEPNAECATAAASALNATVTVQSDATAAAGVATAAATAYDASGPASYPGQVLADSPLLYWRLGESSGTTAADSSGNGRDGTYVSTPTLGVTGALTDGDTAATFNGTDEYAGIADAAWMDVADITVEGWFKTSVGSLTPGFYNAIADRGNGTFSVWINKVGSNAYLYAKVLGAGATLAQLDYTVANVGDNAWHYVALTHDGTTARLYLDGTQVDSAELTQDVQSDSAGILVGASDYSSPHSFFNGSLDEFAFHGTALSAARIAAHYQTGAPPNYGSASATAYDAQVSITATAGGAEGAAVALDPSTPANVSAPAGVASGTGAAYDTAADAQTSPATATAAAAANDATVTTAETNAFADVATATATASNATASTAAETLVYPPAATATAWAFPPSSPSTTSPSAPTRNQANKVAVTAEDPTVGSDGQAVGWSPRSITDTDLWEWRVVVDGVDVTTVNGEPTLPAGELTFTEPFGETTTALVAHGVTRWLLEQGGYGWCRVGAEVRINKHDLSTGALLGNLGSFVVYNLTTAGNAAGGAVTLMCSGALSGPAGVTHYKPPLAGQSDDVGPLIRQALTFPSQRHVYAYTGVVGVTWEDPAAEYGASAASVLDRTERLLLESYTTGRWTIARTSTAATYQLRLKDTTTVDATVTLGAHGVREDLRRALSESPNIIYGTYSTDSLSLDSALRTAPLAYDPKVDPYLYDASTGVVSGPNPSYDASVPRVERFVNVGDAVSRASAAALAQRLIFDPDNLPWFGQIELAVGVPSGSYSGSGDPAGTLSPLDFREGMNVRVRGLPGNPLLHVAGVTLDLTNWRATLTVDEAARDFMEISALIGKTRDPVTNPTTRVDPIRSYGSTYSGASRYYSGMGYSGGGGGGTYATAPAPFTKAVDAPTYLPDGWGWLRPVP